MALVFPPPAAPSTVAGLLPPPAKAPVRHVVAIIAVVALIALSMLIDAGAMFIVPFVFALVVPFEKLFPRHRGQRIRRPYWRTDIAWALSSPALSAVTLVFAIAVALLTFAWVPGLILQPLVAQIPPAAMPFVGILLFDFVSYWAHRWAHEVPILWRFHAVHHSPATMDWVSGFRTHPAEGAILAPPFIILVTAGFDATFTGLLAIIQIFLGLFLHANVRWRMRWIQRLFVTPEFHHWHHSNVPAAHHTNYSIFLPLWDIVFGTYRVPRRQRPMVYGISEPIPDSVAGQLCWPFRSIENPWRWAWQSLVHPRRSARRSLAVVGEIVRAAWQSSRRPTHSARSLDRNATFR